MGDDAAKVNRLLLNMAAFVVIVAGMRAASVLLVPFLLALFLAVLCATPLNWLTAHKVPRVVGVIALVLVILAAGTLTGGLLGNTVLDLTRSDARYDELFATQVAAFDGVVAGFMERFGLEGSPTAVSDYFSPSWLFGLLQQLVANLGQVLTNGVLIILTMVFMLFEMSSFPIKVRAALGEKDASEARDGFNRVGVAIRRYVALKTVISLATGIGVAIWLAIVGVDYPILWGVLAFLLNYIPNIGSIIAAVPAVLLAWLSLGLGTAVVAALGYLVVNVTMANIIEPRVMGYSVGLSTLVVFVSLVFWGWILGPVGMLLSVPLTVMSRIVLSTNESTRWIAVLLGSDRSLELMSAIEAEVSAATSAVTETPPADLQPSSETA
ncbi:MAG: AI-2E family transporter [Gemmatimonadetes bacterium]|nr:AI-2E family transporter [Gemmatimonadota bacterium]